MLSSSTFFEPAELPASNARSLESLRICTHLGPSTHAQLLTDARPTARVVLTCRDTAVVFETDLPHIADGLRSRYRTTDSDPVEAPIRIRILRHPTADTDVAIVSNSRFTLAKGDGEHKAFFGTKDLGTQQLLGGSVADYEADPNCVLYSLIDTELLRCLTEHSPHLEFLHAGTAAMGTRGILLCGQSGSGKTTQTLALGLRSLRVFNDDVAVMDRRTGMLFPYPRYPRVRKPSQELLDALGAELGTDARPVLADGKSDPGVHLAAVVLLSGFATDPVLEPLEKHAAILGLMRQTMVQQRRHPSETLMHLGALLREVACYRLVAGNLSRTTALLENLL